MKKINFSCDKFKSYEKKYSTLYNKEKSYFILTKENLIDIEIDDYNEFSIQKNFSSIDCYVLKFFDIKQYYLLKSYSIASNSINLYNIIDQEDSIKKVITDENFLDVKIKSIYTSEMLNFLKIFHFVNKESDLNIKSMDDLIVIKTKEIGDLIFPHDKFRISAAQSFESKFLILGYNQNISKVENVIDIIDNNFYKFISLPANKLRFINLKEKLFFDFSYFTIE